MTESQVGTAEFPVRPASSATEPASTTRRAMLAGAGAVGASALLAACGTDDGDSLADGDDSGSTGGGTAATTGAPTPTGGTGDGSGSGTTLGKTSAIPEGGGKIFKDEKVVVTQPAKGDFKAFSTTCTHAGCAVNAVKDGTINCPCHGSKFSIEDGSPTDGPATKPLESVSVKVDGDSVTLST